MEAHLTLGSLFDGSGGFPLAGVADELRKPTAEEMANAVWEE